MSIALTSFVVFAASQIGTPGPANMALMATGARFGFRAALPFVAGTPTLTATATVAAVLLSCQIMLHPLWTLAGAGIAKTVAGTIWEKYLMWTLAALTVASVLFVLFGGGI